MIPMYLNFRAASSAALIACSLSVCVCAQTKYTTIDLGPTSRANAIAAGQQGGYTCCGIAVTRHALLWSGAAASVSDLHPASAAAGVESGINAMTLGQQGGFVAGGAALWSGTAASYTSIHPAPYAQSVVLGMGDGQIVGAGKYIDPTQPDSTIQHALLWTAPSSLAFVDLHPGGGWQSSFAYAASGGRQAGALMNSNSEHAVVWSGAARAYVDLHNSKYISTVAYAINGNQQAGYGYMQASGPNGTKFFTNHALMWTGSASTLVDLHPAAYSNSFARALNTTRQVGYGYIGSTYHALAWSGSAASVIDLHQFVPAGYPESEAFAIDALGNIAGLAGDSVSDTWHAVLWVPVQ